MTTKKTSFNTLLTEILTSSIKNENFSAQVFFKNWFKERGTSYFFLFKKNFKVTNMQIVELLSLLRSHTYFKENDEKIKDLQFISSNEFYHATDELVKTFSKDKKTNAKNYQLISKLYAPIFKRAIVIDIFFDSCAIFIPPHLKIDLPKICGYSGYIHSCGYNVFIRRSDKAIKNDFFKSIKKHLSKYFKEKSKIFFAVYAHEDFTQFDRKRGSELRDGLDEVKVFVEKFYMGRETFVSVLKDMRGEFDNLVIPEPGNYHTIHKKFREMPGVEKSRTLWLIIDHSINKNNIKYQGEERYFICYDQVYVNENPFHLFDENKPAWISHTTIPHTLNGAMINLTKPWWPENEKITIIDPFVGSGTTWLESLKYSNVSSRGSDINPITDLLVKDNLEFFSASPETLQIWIDRLGELEEFLYSPSKKRRKNPELSKAYHWAKDIIDIFENQEDEDFKKSINKITLKNFFDRLLLYIALRTSRRHIAAFEREAEDWRDAYLNEAFVLISQMKNLYKLKVQDKIDNIDLGTNVYVSLGSYSHSCSIDLESVGKILKSHDSYIKVSDVRKLKPDSCDVIVADPPYGFNTDDDPTELAKLYRDFIEKCILALKYRGQLVLCLPDHSMTGRNLPYFTFKELIVQQVLAIAELNGKEVFCSATAVPEPCNIFRPPYYWESERALRRAIVHFRFHARQ